MESFLALCRVNNIISLKNLSWLVAIENCELPSHDAIFTYPKLDDLISNSYSKMNKKLIET